eukprot:CAMPEP_0196570478 /NCGR_PEP_ID=MMETSP1081-20130531/569_1 /TAXON_ID=36882 /ORGANISM="Pyramimonas amylifera, Strain CCMP720" /LENGTH=331 /DNA_ID=CAMNT_0041886943 /DNA_START=100 /DNA_END=1095 /DNA_ORIENTATION=+
MAAQTLTGNYAVQGRSRQITSSRVIVPARLSVVKPHASRLSTKINASSFVEETSTEELKKTVRNLREQMGKQQLTQDIWRRAVEREKELTVIVEQLQKSLQGNGGSAMPAAPQDNARIAELESKLSAALAQGGNYASASAKEAELAAQVEKLQKELWASASPSPSVDTSALEAKLAAMETEKSIWSSAVSREKELAAKVAELEKKLAEAPSAAAPAMNAEKLKALEAKLNATEADLKKQQAAGSKKGETEEMKAMKAELAKAKMDAIVSEREAEKQKKLRYTQIHVSGGGKASNKSEKELKQELSSAKDVTWGLALIAVVLAGAVTVLTSK